MSAALRSFKHPRLGLALAAGAVLAAGVLSVSDDAGAKTKKAQPRQRAKNVIVMISDGMGYNQLAAADYYQSGAIGTQAYERFPVHSTMSTYSYYGNYNPFEAWGLFSYLKQKPTDSAAAATAMSTGVKTYDAAIGVDVDKRPLYHLTQEAEKRGKATGVITSVEFSHATPAGFVAHNASRNDYEGIAREMINDSATDVIMGAGHPLFDDSGAPRAAANYRYVGGQTTWDALTAGTAGGDADGNGTADAWKLIQSKDEFTALAGSKKPAKRICGIAQAATTLQQGRAGDTMAAPGVVAKNANVPDLATMTKGALNVLGRDRDGFVLMVEGGAIDWASHANQPGRTIEEQMDFNQSVNAVLAWIKQNSNWGETLLIVTGDHETGYLWGPGTGANPDGSGNWMPLVNNGAGVQPGMQFNSGDHTNSVIPFFAKGSAARHFKALATGNDPRYGAYIDNTDIAKVAFKTMR